MSKSKSKEAWRVEAGRKGGKSRSRAKVAAGRANVLKGSVIWSKLRRIERDIVVNRNAWFKSKDASERAKLDEVFVTLILKRDKLNIGAWHGKSKQADKVSAA